MSKPELKDRINKDIILQAIDDLMATDIKMTEKAPHRMREVVATLSNAITVRNYIEKVFEAVPGKAPSKTRSNK